ncbi:MarR family transcriptional regulator [Cryobacterium sp. SO2]|uniref:MarR family winged helix-turn-helix transcriptional regulator n=1 Tax=Cryobacterium sp. SO2 TaxID=1897060 RepID=UPI00223D73A8|nr:MarR family transcriptional regulator [Cryobacterium sp. SO2]WEO78677.1 MarR family transcriptional regulator [Cryobacterium sp. SO2]
MADTQMLPPEQQICFALYSASRSITGRYRTLLAPLGITYPQYLAMLVLWETGTSTVSQLGDRLQLDSGTLSPLLKRLESLGLVTRGRSESDERVVKIALTPAGDAMRSHAPHIAEQICASTGLPLDELVDLQNQIAALAQRVRALT